MINHPDPGMVAVPACAANPAFRPPVGIEQHEFFGNRVDQVAGSAHLEPARPLAEDAEFSFYHSTETIG